jgi:hypothetical protein
MSSQCTRSPSRKPQNDSKGASIDCYSLQAGTGRIGTVVAMHPRFVPCQRDSTLEASGVFGASCRERFPESCGRQDFGSFGSISAVCCSRPGRRHLACRKDNNTSLASRLNLIPGLLEEPAYRTMSTARITRRSRLVASSFSYQIELSHRLFDAGLHVAKNDFRLWLDSGTFHQAPQHGSPGSLPQIGKTSSPAAC